MAQPLSLLLRRGALSLASVALASCVTPPAAVTLPQAAAALKADGTAGIRFAGTGRWYQFGQAPAPGQPWPAFDVSRYNASVDFTGPAARVQITRRQVIEPGRERPAPVDQSVDQFVTGTLAWNLPVAPAGGPATPQPAAVAERLAEIWSTPQGFLKAAQAHQARTSATAEGTEVSFRVEGRGRYVGLLDGRGQVQKVQTWIDTPVLGDTLVETQFSDYKDFAGLPFPSRIVRRQGGHTVLDLQVTQASAGADSQSLAIPTAPPEVAAAPAAPVTVTATLLAPGVFYLTGGTHHSVAIEQRDHVVLVEAPQNEARSLALLAKLGEIVPAKPVRHVVNTHAHFDHSGGLRTFVDRGAIIVTHQANQPFYEAAWAAPRSLQPDRLAGSGKPARFETFTGRHVLSDGQRSIHVIEIAANGHNDAFALVYLPAEKILIEADAYTPVAANAPLPAAPNPYTVNLYQNIQRLQLDVARIAALHGPRVTTLADLRAAIGPAAATAQR